MHILLPVTEFPCITDGVIHQDRLDTYILRSITRIPLNFDYSVKKSLLLNLKSHKIPDVTAFKRILSCTYLYFWNDFRMTGNPLSLSYDSPAVKDRRITQAPTGYGTKQAGFHLLQRLNFFYCYQADSGA